MTPELELDLFSPPPPPTGPAAEVPTREQNRFKSYQEWRATEEGRAGYGWILREALRLSREFRLAGFQVRISVNALVERYRSSCQSKVNNTWRAWIADDLVTDAPELLDLIERRKRKKAKGE